MVFTAKISTFEGIEARVYQAHLPLPEHVAKEMLKGDNKRFICTLNKSITIHSGVMASSAYRYILLNKTLLSQLKLQVGDEIQVEMVVDTSRYGMDIPAEFEEVLDTDPVAYTYFEKLTPGKQRNLIYIVASVKNTESRISKSLAIAEHLRESDGKLDFRRLNALIKHYNNKNKST